jgi:AraC-like DNA-binding protein
MFLYWQKKPDVVLRPFVKNYWHFRREFKRNVTHVIYPDSYYELIWVKHGTLYVNGIEPPKLFFSGFNESKITLTGKGKVEIFGVRFYAWGCVPFTDMDFSDNKLFEPADKFLGASGLTSLENILQQNTSNFYETLNNFLVSMMAVRQQDKGLSNKQRDYLEKMENLGSIRELVKASGLSNRQLERHIQKSTGSTPKEVLRRIRFEKVRKALVEREYRNLSELAHEHGYSDQSHLSKEFRKFTGMTPLQFGDEFHGMYAHLKRSGKWEWD